MASKFVSILRSASQRSRAVKFALSPAIATRRMYSRHVRAIQQACYDHLRVRLSEDPVMEIGECDGTFAMDVRSDIFKRLVFNGEYEPDLMRLCRSLIDPQRDAIDVGANLGFFTVLFSKILAPSGRRVVCVEPTPNALRRLHANIQRNGVADTATVFEGVVSSAPGMVELTVIVGKEEYSCLSGGKHPRITGVEGVEFAVEQRQTPATTVDLLVAENGLDPGFIKVDVEGAELMVFQGAEATLAKSRPIVLSELCEPLLAKAGATIAEVIEVFQRHDYAVLDPSDLGSTAPRFVEEEMLCIPREKLESYAKRLQSLHP